jgi:predicted Abi (CAAX) family protease
MKRKADVLDEEETPEAEEQVVVPAEHFATVIVPVSEVTAPQTAAIIAQRPKKTPRSLISKLGSTATYFGYGAAGAAGAFALLSALPDAFFV